MKSSKLFTIEITAGPPEDEQDVRYYVVADNMGRAIRNLLLSLDQQGRVTKAEEFTDCFVVEETER